MTIDRRSQDSAERILSSELAIRNKFGVIQTRRIDIMYFALMATSCTGCRRQLQWPE